MKYWLCLLCFLGLSLDSLAVSGPQVVVTSDQVKLHIDVQGQGPPLLYIHGGPGSGSHWLQKFSGDFLESRFQVIYLDQRGVARSSSPANGDFSLARMLRDFETIREQLGIKRWYTLGHSFGGIMQVAYAQAHPDSHLGMLMFNTTLYLDESLEAALPKIYQLLDAPEPPQAGTGQSPFARIMPLLNELRERDLFWQMQYLDKANEATMNATFEEIPNWNWDFGNAVWELEEYTRNFKPATADIQMPVLFFYGERDWMVGTEHYQGVRFPNMLLWSSPAGHVPFMEDTEGLAQAIDQYLANDSRSVTKK